MAGVDELELLVGAAGVVAVGGREVTSEAGPDSGRRLGRLPFTAADRSVAVKLVILTYYSITNI